MRKSILCSLLVALLASNLQAQTPTSTTTTATTTPAATPPAEQKVTLYGFVRNDIYLNSRRNLDLRDGVLDVYPQDATNLDTRTGTVLTKNANEDANAISQLGYSAVVTRLGVRFGGISAFGAKASGVLETDFLVSPMVLQARRVVEQKICFVCVMLMWLWIGRKLSY